MYVDIPKYTGFDIRTLLMYAKLLIVVLIRLLNIMMVIAEGHYMSSWNLITVYYMHVEWFNLRSQQVIYTL